MKPGDLVTLKHGRVAVTLLSESLEKTTEFKKIVYNPDDSRPFRRGDTAIVVEIDKKNLARVKIYYDSSMWWGNVSDLTVV